MIQDIPKNIVERMIKSKQVRTAIIRKSHYLFFHFYFHHYVVYPTADFQREIFGLTEDKNLKNFFIVAFRGSAKSTIITMSYPIWAILGEQQKKFVLILCQTRVQAKQHMVNLKRELESNTLLKNDLGPFQEDADEWGTSSLVFSNINARISVASCEQSIRGLRHNQYRPDLIIGDDVEDMNSTRTREGRDKTYQWLTSEVIPAGDRETRLIIIGNLLHEDSLLMRLKRDLDDQKIDGVFKSYPLLDKDGLCLWPGKFPAFSDIENEKKKIGSEIAWQREYLLQIITDEGQVIFPEWIQYYEKLPEAKDCRKIVIGIDLAISKKETACYTAMVFAYLCDYGENFRAYILPNPINKRMSFPETITQAKLLYDSLHNEYCDTSILVEEVGYQQAVTEQLNNDNYLAEGVKISSDKRSRLMSTGHLIQTGKILFPKEGSEKLIGQILGFGVERYDDLVDAFTILAHKAIQENKPVPFIGFA